MGKQSLIDKALSSVFGKRIDTLVDERLEKSLGDPINRDQKSWLIDILNAGNGMNYKSSPNPVTYSTLRLIAKRNPVISAIINTRVNQVASFAKQLDTLQFSTNKSIGFKVVHKRKHQKDYTKEETEFATSLEDFLSLCGYTDRFRSGRKRDNFTDFLKKITRDRLTLDQTTFEKVNNRKGEPAEFFAVDAATIRLASERDMDDGIGYVQVVQGNPVNEYKWSEMAFCVANPITDIEQYGYGFSELEMLITVVTALFYADSYNSKFFSQGLGVQGILNIASKEGTIPPDILEAFRTQMQSQSTGPNNQWRTPVTSADKLEWINLKPSSREMEYVKWIEYLIKLATAIFQISPEEINFESRSGSSALTEADPESRLKYSKDKGLKPLLTFLADSITEHLIEPYSLDYMCVFIGLDEKDEKEAVEIRKLEGECYKTVDELRAESSLEPLGEDKGGDLILNPSFISAKNSKDMMDNMNKMNAASGNETGSVNAEDKFMQNEDKPNSSKNGQLGGSKNNG